jgi:hypothetical protein
MGGLHDFRLIAPRRPGRSRSDLRRECGAAGPRTERPLLWPVQDAAGKVRRTRSGPDKVRREGGRRRDVGSTFGARVRQRFTGWLLRLSISRKQSRRSSVILPRPQSAPRRQPDHRLAAPTVLGDLPYLMISFGACKCCGRPIRLSGGSGSMSWRDGWRFRFRRADRRIRYRYGRCKLLLRVTGFPCT